MMKKVKAFTVIDMMVVIAILGILAGILIPALSAEHHRTNERSNVLQLKVGDAVYIDTLYVTGIVNTVNNMYAFPRVTMLIKGTNGFPIQLDAVDVRLLKKVPPSPESEWKR